MVQASRRAAALSALFGILLAACGQAAPSASTQPKVELTLQPRYAADSARGKVIQTMLDAFHQKNPNITVRLAGTPYAPEKILTLATSSDAPDVMQVPEEAISDFGDKGVFLDITDKVKDLQNSFYAPVWEFTQNGGKTYSLPWFGHTMQLIYSRAAFKTAGLDPAKPPATWEELKRTAQALTKGSQYGFGLVGKQSHDLAWQWDMFLWQAGGKLVEKKGDKWRVALNSPAGVRALQFYISMKPVSEPEVATSSAVETGNAFVAKRVAMHYLGPWAIADAWQKAPDADVYAAPLPKDVNRATVYSTENLVMFRNNKHPAESLKLMRFLAGPDAAKLLMVGEGGKYPFRVPVIKSMESDPFFQKDHPEFKAFLQGFSYGEKIFPIKGWTRVHNEAMQLHLNKAVNGQETPENALAAIEREGNKILDEIYKY
jgi:ABC-type glycerol-3-phosphate transport system substrate-binding protein